MDGHRSKRSKLSHEEDSNSRVPITVQEGENGSDEESDCGSSSNVDDESGVELQVEFEARQPQADDLHGVMLLLQQLFLKESMNVLELAGVIVDQSDVGSVIKVVHDESGDDDDDDDDDDDYDDDDSDDGLYGFITVLSFQKHKNKRCFGDLDQLLESKMSTLGGGAEMLATLRDGVTNIGWVVSERLVNIPHQIALPLYKSLVKDIAKAKKKETLFDFQYYLVVSKCYKGMPSQATKMPVRKRERTKRRIKQERLEADAKDSDVVYCNAEDALFSQVAEASMCFPVGEASGTALAGEWNYDDDELVPYRMVMLLTSSQFHSAIAKMDSHFPEI